MVLLFSDKDNLFCDVTEAVASASRLVESYWLPLASIGV